MNNLETLVPPPELCRQIPAGRFEDSALVWYRATISGDYVVLPRLYKNVDAARTVAPAPTLEEILREMAKYPHRFNNLMCDAYEEKDFGVTAFIPYRGKPDAMLTEYRDKSGATAALKLFLGVKE